MGFSFGFGGSKDKTSSSGTSQSSKQGTQSKQLKLDQAAIEKIIADVLGGPQGLASIFGGEQTAGIFNSSVAAQSSGDLVANLVGELAKLTGEEVTSFTESGTESFSQKGKSSSKNAKFGFSSGD